MKKIAFLLIIALFTIKAQAQTGDLTLGARGAYITKHEGFLYGLDLSYQLSPLLEISASGLMNSKIHKKDKEFNDPDWDRDISFYSGALDLRFLLINSELLATGPSLGGQYMSFKSKNRNGFIEDEESGLGFNLGWHVRVTLAENLKLTGGWRYTNSKESILSHHTFYVGVGYAFNLF